MTLRNYTKCNILMVWCGPVHLTFPSNVAYACVTFNKWHKKKNYKNKMTLHILTHGAMQGCEFTSLMVCIYDKIHDILERNVTMRSEI